MIFRPLFGNRGGRAASQLALACALASALGLGALSPAFAERADRGKPVNLEANRITVDDAKKVHVFEGNVRLVQGTLVILADKLIVSQDAEGFQKGVAHGAPARFRQKREGIDEYVEGEAERIEYDARTERAEFFGKARVKSGGDEVRGAYIAYDGIGERYLASSAGADGKPVAGADGRVRAVIQPKARPADGSAAPAPVAPDPALLKRDDELKSKP